MTGDEFNRAVADAYARMEAEILAPLADAYRKVLRRFGRQAAAAYKTQAVVAGARWDELYDPDELAAEVTRETLRLRRASVERMIGDVLAAASISFDVAPLLVPSLLEHIGVRARDLDHSMRDSLRRTIETAAAEGWTVPETATAIQAGVNSMAGYTAEALARTDLIGLANGGSIVAAREVLGPTTMKTWLATPDERTRETHVEADGQTVPLEQPFTVGGELLDYPGDPSGSDEEVINCRCTVLYEEAPVTAAATTEEDTMGEQTMEVNFGGAAFRVTGASSTGGWNFTTVTADDPNAMPVVAAAPVEAEAEGQLSWVSDIAFEGTPTGDGRFIVEGGLGWRTPPLTLMAQTVTAEGHDGAEVSGRMDAFFRDTEVDMDGAALPEGVNAIRAVGVFDGGEQGSEIGRLVNDEVLRGVSVDLAIDEWAFRDPDTGEILDPESMSDDQWERAFFGELEYAILKGTIMAATVCPTPAFGDARIAVIASAAEDGTRTLTAKLWAPIRLRNTPLGTITAAAAGVAPLHPPRDWFNDPQLSELTPSTVTEDGRVYGHFAPATGCHVGNASRCVPPPRNADYSWFHHGVLTCDDGSEVTVGQITMDTGHANSSPSYGARRALEHYDHTGTVVADVRVGEDAYGTWFAGALRPDLPAEKVRAFRATGVSGDWRPEGGRQILTGILTVNQSGFPIRRKELAVVTASGVVATGDPTPSRADGDATDGIRLRVLAARAVGGMEALAEIAR